MENQNSVDIKGVVDIKNYRYYIMGVVLMVLKEHPELNFVQLKEACKQIMIEIYPSLRSDYFELNYLKSGANIFHTLLHWAIVHSSNELRLISKEGKAKQALYRLTDMGKKYMAQPNITSRIVGQDMHKDAEMFIRQYDPEFWAQSGLNPEMRKARKKRLSTPQESQQNDLILEDEYDDDIDEHIEEESFDSTQEWESLNELHKNHIRSEILETINALNPIVVEKFIGKLLVKMGYGSVTQTQATRDGGIDLIIDKDVIGVEKIHVQVKRYKQGNNIGIDTINSFLGAIKHQVGLFVTTSDFTPDGKKRAKEANLALVNGSKLVDYILEYQEGVSIKQTYNLFKIDTDYFNHLSHFLTEE